MMFRKPLLGKLLFIDGLCEELQQISDLKTLYYCHKLKEDIYAFLTPQWSMIYQIKMRFNLSPHFHKSLQYISKKSVLWNVSVAKKT